MKLKLIFTTILFLLPVSLFATTETFLTEGPGSWTCPTGVTSIQIEGWGAGAGGGGSSSNNIAPGGGGGGGAYSKLNTLAVTPGNSYNFVVGAKGTGGAGANHGTDGGNTTFNATSMVATGGGHGHCSVSGGQGGLLGSGGASASCTGDTKYSGGNGASGTGGVGGISGGGGSSAGTGSNGNNGGNTTPAGAGGTAPEGGYAGKIGAVASGSASNNDATNYGGAGGAGGEIFSGSRNGGDGTGGRIVLTYTESGGATVSGRVMYFNEDGREQGTPDAPAFCSKPTSKPSGWSGPYDEQPTVTLATATSGADIYYTKGQDWENPPDPTAGDTLYTGPIILGMVPASTMYIKAVAIKAGLANSEIMIAEFRTGGL